MYPLGILPFAPSVQPSESADSKKSSEDFELGIDIKDPTNAANRSDLTAVQSRLILTEIPNTSGDQLRVDRDKITLGARGGVLGWYTANTLQGHGQSTHHIPTWALEVHS